MGIAVGLGAVLTVADGVAAGVVAAGVDGVAAAPVMLPRSRIREALI